ncbi:hypothetical protein [Leifsonia aquatica]|uniref:Translation elongation factor EF-Tu-like GTPase n=1 Tax=Leifsonia aquatica TaxID=144185 RepID=A0A7W4UZ21_LEIAQ|nr:hypothetical protein [Leifsonia aquatica]MBB2968582.1 translation elongation factor EF-Tu-like GTPase [Leifsonia aquatica]
MQSIRATIRLLPGGRRSPVSLDRGYRPHLVVADGDPLGVVIRGVSRARLEPGGVEVEVLVELPYDIDYGTLVAGATFSLLEGPNVVGTGIVL